MQGPCLQLWQQLKTILQLPVLLQACDKPQHSDGRCRMQRPLPAVLHRLQLLDESTQPRLTLRGLCLS